MEKIRLNNGQEFELIPMGINDNIVTKRRKFTFISDLTYAEIEAQFTNDNVAKIEHLNDVEALKVYLDCTALKALSKNIDTGTYTVELSVDEVERELSTVKSEVQANQIMSDGSIAELTIMIANLYGMLSQ